jgi:hypothetical protein
VPTRRSHRSCPYDPSLRVPLSRHFHRRRAQWQLSPVPVPFVLMPRRAGGGLRWHEGGQGAGREAKLVGGSAFVLGMLLLVALPFAIASRHPSDIAIISVCILVLCGLGAAFFFLGVRIAATTRILDIVGSQVRISREGAGPVIDVHAHVAECSLLVHHVRFNPPRGPGWEGYAAVLHVGPPGRSERFALAAAKSRDVMVRFAEDFQRLGARSGEGEPLTHAVSVGIGIGNRRIGKGHCPTCGYDLLGRFLGGCAECGWGRRKADR